MDVAAIIQLVGAVAQGAKLAIDAGRSAAPFVQALYTTFHGKTEISQADLEALQAEVDRLSEELDAPLPPEDPQPQS